MNFANHIDIAARNVPRKPAVADTDELLTYGRLSAKTNAVANALAGLEVKPGDRVAIILPNQLEFLTMYLGAMKRGAIPVPVNIHFNDQQIRYVFETSDISVIITNKQFATLSKGNKIVITTDGSIGYEYRSLLDKAEEEYEVHPRRSDETAEVLYTSGTTGRPKGVRHTHGNLRANAFGIIAYMAWSRHVIGLTVCQCFHVTGLNVTTTPLLVAAAENRLLPEWDPEAVLMTIENHGVSYAFFTPSMVIDLLDHDDVVAYNLSSLDIIGVGGSPMPKERIEDAEETLDCTLVEGYGMTETTPLAAFNRPDDTRKPGSVGRPARDVVALRIENLETGKPVDQGERGELLWRGDTVTPGYEQWHGDGQLFVDRDGKQWLRSGDIGWLDEDDHLFIVDRREDMFTTGCANVFPRKIEDVLYGIEEVVEAAVVDTSDELRGAVVTAIVTSTDELAPDQVKRVCGEHLDEHEVPQRIEFVEEIPRTVTGKIDRVALRDAFG
jgi:long-chain acyl-CoA synthetase